MVDRSAQVEIFPREMGLKRVDPACNMKRFYRMTIERDLFGSSSMIRMPRFHPIAFRLVNRAGFAGG